MSTINYKEGKCEKCRRQPVTPNLCSIRRG
jgi:hypothetical protein